MDEVEEPKEQPETKPISQKEQIKLLIDEIDDNIKQDIFVLLPEPYRPIFSNYLRNIRPKFDVLKGFVDNLQDPPAPPQAEPEPEPEPEPEQTE